MKLNSKQAAIEQFMQLRAQGYTVEQTARETGY